MCEERERLAISTSYLRMQAFVRARFVYLGLSTQLHNAPYFDGDSDVNTPNSRATTKPWKDEASSLGFIPGMHVHICMHSFMHR